ncbi:hypothetical protein [Endozoicomonas lisbonensis]
MWEVLRGSIRGKHQMLFWLFKAFLNYSLKFSSHAPEWSMTP